MLLRAVDAAVALAPPDPRDPSSRFAQSAEMGTALRRVFENIAMAKVSTSAAEARSLGLLGPADRITLNRERLLLDAKAQVETLADAGYTAPQPRTAVPAPGISALATMETGAFLMGEAGYASEHDQKVARWIAYILAGGRVTAGSAGERTVSAGSGARGVSVTLRGAEDAGADCFYAEDGKAAAELDTKPFGRLTRCRLFRKGGIEATEESPGSNTMPEAVLVERSSHSCWARAQRRSLHHAARRPGRTGFERGFGQGSGAEQGRNRRRDPGLRAA